MLWHPISMILHSLKLSMNNTDLEPEPEPLIFNPPPSIPLYDGLEVLKNPLVLTINCNASIESAKLERLDEFVGVDYSLDINSSISSSTLTLTINSFGSMFPFYCSYVDTNTMETRTVHNTFNILPGEKIYEYHKTQATRMILNLEIITKRLVFIEGIPPEEDTEYEEIETTNFQIITNSNYTTQIPFLLSEVASGDS